MPAAAPEQVPDRSPALNPDRPIVLVGLMGAGKTRVGKSLAARLSLPFVDTDHAIEAETGKSIAELFALVGEQGFRDGERRLIARLLEEPPAIIASGGGAFLDPTTRARIRDRAISVWLKAELETLVARTSRSNKRPLLHGVDPRRKLAELMSLRHPVYAEADVIVDSCAASPEKTAEMVVAALLRRSGSGS